MLKVTDVERVEHEITTHEMREVEEDYTIEEPRLVEKTETVYDDRSFIEHVEKKINRMITVPKQIEHEVQEERQIQRTEMVERCVEDHFQETRTLRFDPLTGQQIGCDVTMTGDITTTPAGNAGMSPGTVVEQRPVYYDGSQPRASACCVPAYAGAAMHMQGSPIMHGAQPVAQASLDQQLHSLELKMRAAAQREVQAAQTTA